jgi:hypothetical protein
MKGQRGDRTAGPFQGITIPSRHHLGAHGVRWSYLVTLPLTERQGSADSLFQRGDSRDVRAIRKYPLPSAP